MIGGDMFTSDFRFSQSSISVNKLLCEEKPKSQSISFFSAFMILLNFGVTSDPFYMSYAMKTGIISFIITCIVILILTQISFLIFTKLWRYNAPNTYENIWENVFGPSLKWIPKILVIFSCASISAVNSYETITDFTDLIKPLVSRATANVLLNQWFQSYVIFIITTVPFITCSSSIRILALISYIANISVLIAVIILVILSARGIYKNGFNPESKLVFFSNNEEFIKECFSSLLSLFFVHPFVAQITQQLQAPTLKTPIKLSWANAVVSAFINIIAGLAGYFLFFGENDDKNIFEEFDPHDPIVIIGKTAQIIALVFSNTVYCHVSANELKEVILPTGDSIVARFMSGIVIASLNVVLTFIGEMGIAIAELFGTISFAILAFAIPCIFYLRIFKMENVYLAILSIILLVASIPLCVFILYVDCSSLF